MKQHPKRSTKQKSPFSGLCVPCTFFHLSQFNFTSFPPKSLPRLGIAERERNHEMGVSHNTTSSERGSSAEPRSLFTPLLLHFTQRCHVLGLLKQLTQLHYCSIWQFGLSITSVGRGGGGDQGASVLIWDSDGGGASGNSVCEWSVASFGGDGTVL